MEATADLHSSQLTVKAHRPWRIGCDLTGIFVATFTAAICSEKQSIRNEDKSRGAEEDREVRWMKPGC